MASISSPSTASTTVIAQASPLTPSLTVEPTVRHDAEPVTIPLAIRQDPMGVTLDGPAVFALALSVVVSLHFLEPAAVAVLVGSAPLLLFVRNDYNNYLKLGPGGTPSTFSGYLKITWFRFWALRDPFTPLPSDPAIEPRCGILHKAALPYRCGPRPQVAGIAPQRQLNQPGSRECYLALRQIMTRHSEQHIETIGTGTSCFEKHGLGLFARFPINTTCQGEICHVHDSDYSMHLNLHPDDARVVLEKGWGQRHPLTAQGWLKMPVPKQFTMVYAPRSADELAVVCRIIQAAEWWVTAKELHLGLLGHERCE